MYGTSIELWEILLTPLYLLVPFALVFLSPQKKDRKWFALGMSARLAGAILYTLIYFYYYQGGDTIAYFRTAVPFVNMLLQDPETGIKLIFSSYSRENLALFNSQTGYPLVYIYEETNTTMVSKVIIPFLLLSFKSYLLGTILLATFSFFGPWKLFKLLEHLSPGSRNIALFCTIFFPSVLFWGSGISKDTITFASICYLVHGYYFIVIKREFKLGMILFSLMSAYFILTIKPYIFLVFFPGILVWFFFKNIQNIKYRFIRISIVPFILVLSLGIFALTFSYISEYLGDYSSTEKIIEKAIVSQEDLKRDYYGGNTFDIGQIEPSITGILSKFPLATFYGLYGPTLIHVNNVVMLFSALENTLLLVLTLLVFLARNPVESIRKIASSPFLIFCLSFSLFLAFAIGLTTPNFGALVRFKIPLVPFFCFMLLVVYYRKPLKT